MKTSLYPHVVQAYIKESGNIRTHHSRESYTKVMRLLQSVYPEKGIADLTAEDLTTFCISRYDGKPGHAAPSTQKNRRAHIRSTFEWAVWKKYRTDNPALELKFTVKPGKGMVRTGRWLDQAEVLKVLSALDTNDEQDQRDRLVVMTGILTGLRRFELAGLTWDAFSEDLSTLTIKGKGDKIVRLGVAPELQAALVKWKHRRQMGGIAVFPSCRWVFNPSLGKRVRVINWDKPLGEAGVGYVVAHAGERSGIKLDPHDLRRTLAGLLEARGIPLKDIQNLMRHENIATTDRYLSKNPARSIATAQGFTLGI